MTKWMRRLFVMLVLGTLAPCQIGATMANGQHVDITTKGPDGLPVIFWLIKQRDQAAVGAWLDSGGNIEAEGYHGATPVLAAAIVDNWPMVLYLIERGARMGVTDARGFTLAYRSATTRVAPDGILGPPLNAVRAHLAEAGLLERLYDPAAVRRMQAEGRWPPPGYR
ncbi:MAG: hypothetical protein CVT70_14950 [Alphaproteobacteria bacterium HGW-Alphaproteobacteria-1]|nr:MAG: hypothetical protein CVT70_14950 [Alphaproteobacteria bacterium HGW-Alphaproteobacteria-1]